VSIESDSSWLGKNGSRQSCKTVKKFMSWRRKTGNFVLLASNIKPRRLIMKLEDDKFKTDTKWIFCTMHN